jgi:hypothetical protein
MMQQKNRENENAHMKQAGEMGTRGLNTKKAHQVLGPRMISYMGANKTANVKSNVSS